jgi:hypothetical protein
MKATMTLLILFCFSSFVFGQTYDTVATIHFGNGAIINKVDSFGRKQGLWIKYRMFFDSRCSALETGISDTCFRKLSEGEYFNYRKVGTWVYYDDGGCYILRDKAEIFNPDGSVLEFKNDGSTATDYSYDSSLVTSRISVNDDTVLIKCQNKKTCTAMLGNKILKKFTYDKLDVEQYIISRDGYQREILLLKNNSR